ncbi:MAG TPA: CHRD domain-containing protein [Candidatus Dormibacteraeota bacterium]
MSRLVALAATVMMATACGSADTSSTSSPATSPSSSPAAITPATTPSPAALVFQLKGVAPATSSGTITVTTTPGTLTVELKITGLQASSIHVSHVHVGTCAARGGILRALNPVIADSQGGADTKTTVNLKYPPASGHLYVVVHVGPDMVGTNSRYLLCGNLFK